MKTHFLNFAAAALIVLAAAACNKEEIINTGDDGTKAIALSISIGEPGTKGAVMNAPYKDLEDGFETLDIYFTNTGGKILYHWFASAVAADSDGQTLWENFVNNSTNGVKFLGLSGDVTGVYVVANVKTLEIDGTPLGNGLITSDANIDALNESMKLIEYGPAKEQTAMPYAGGDITLTPTSNVNESAGEIFVDGGSESGNYVKADIRLRPAISRVEIEQVGVKTHGTNYYEYANGDLEQITNLPEPLEADKEYYSVAWENFNVHFVGVYMSDVYRKTYLFPASSEIAQWNNPTGNFFSTPVFTDGQPPIKEGNWVELSTTEQDLNNILAYANYTSVYQDLVTDQNYISKGTPNNWLFKGAGGEGSVNPNIIPFHFFVPYNVTDGEDVSKVGDSESVDPKLHFQFTKGDVYDNQDGGFKIVQILKYTQDNPDGEKVSVGNVFEQLEVMYNWPSTLGDGTAYANVIKFVDREVGGSIVDIKPGYIYRLQQVLIDPTNLNPAPSNNDVNDIYVVVTVEPFYVQDVYPVFE